MNTVIAVVGILLLVALAIGVGASMDTTGQRAAGRAAAHERRLRNEELRSLREQRERLRDEWVRLTEERLRSAPRRGAEPPADDRTGLRRQQLIHIGVIVAVCPLLTWLIVVTPGWL